MNDSPFRGGTNGPDQEPATLLELDPASLARYARIAFTALVGLIALYALNWALGFYTDWLWFRQLGYDAVLVKIIASQFWLFAAGLILFLAIAGGNIYLFFRMTREMRVLPSSQFPQEWYATARRTLRWISLAVVLVFGIFLAERVAGEWEKILLFLNAVPFGEADPIFERDISFYLFTLPIIDFFRTWLLTVLVTTILLVGALYYVTAQMRGTRLSFEEPLRSHVLGLGAGFFVLIAVGHWLSRYELLYSTTGAVVGVGYTEANATLPALSVMTVVALATAVLLIYAIFGVKDRVVFFAAGGWFALNIIATGVIPSLVQRLQVEPNELAREEQYLVHHIALTRQAYGLDRVQNFSHPALGTVDSRTLAENPGTVQNIRLWDEGPLLESYNQIQFFRLYYDFLAVTTDRYEIDGQLRQVMLSTRELSAEKLPEEAQRWVNRQLQFTHGYGVAMTPVTEVDAGGRPAFFVKDVPPSGKLSLDRPEVYYGLKSLDYVVVNSRMEEFNYPGPDGPVYTHYAGAGGVPLSSFFRRLLYAWEFRDLNLLISGQITPESRIQYRRTIPHRFSTLAPFLVPDRSPYVVVADGRLFWIQDAYTMTDRFPYSARWRGSFNYIRNSVKAVIDAYDGSVQFYVADETDPILQAYRKIFPTMFQDLSEMPPSLEQHIRYPLDFFTFQVQMLLQYQMTNPTVFYNKEDQWDLPVESSFGQHSTLLPYYIVARLPDEDREEFLLIQPFTPVNRHNLVAWIAARNDPENYGQLMLYRFPSGRHVDGPNQIEARIDNDAIISEQFTLWGQVGSEVSRGILLVIPIGDSILYAEPVFLRPDTLEFPELRRIILADASSVVMQPTMDRSIRALAGELPPVAPAAELVDPDAPPIEVAERPRTEVFDAEDLESLRRGLQDVADRLQELLEQLNRR